MTDQIRLNTRFYRMFPAVHYEGYASEPFQADIARSCFLAVDVYGVGRKPKADEAAEPAAPQEMTWRGSAEAQDAIVRTALAPALHAARQAGMPIVYVNNSAPRIGLRESEFGKMQRRQVGTVLETRFAESMIDPREYHQGTDDYLGFADVLAPQDGDYFIRKHVYSGFVGTRLDQLLRNLDIKTIFISGFSADACLLTTVIDALWHNYKVVLLRDCTLANEFPGEQADLLGTQRMVRLMEALYCVSVTSAEFIQGLAHLPSPSSDKKERS